MWEIFGYQNSDSLFGIFNAIAAVMGSGGYNNSLAIVVTVGFFAAFFSYACQPQRLVGWYWLAMVVLVSSILIVPRVRVAIIDKTGGGPVQMVDNVPFGAALLGSLTSRIGNTLTELIETALQVLPGAARLPAELTYQRHGLVFGDRLVRDTRTVVLQDPATRTDLINFVNNCTTYDLIDGTLSVAAFSSSDNIWPLMGTPNPARFTPVAVASGTYVTMTCPEAYRALDGRMPAQISAIQGKLALQLNPTLPAAVAKAVIAGQIEQAYARNQLTTAAASAADLIRQNALINAINESSQITGQRLNDPASLLLTLARSQATAQANAGWINGARMAEQAMPIMRNAIEAITYAIYPLMILLLFIAPLRDALSLVKTYALVLVWIQLWPPLYAVLGYVASVYGAHELAAAAEIGGGVKALSIQTAGSIYSTAISGAAAVGGMTTSIPVIAWALVRGMSSYGTSVMQSMSVLTAITQRDSAANATGDVSLGNTTMDQRTVTPTTSNPLVTRTQTANGDWLTRDGTGRMAVDKLANSGYASRVVSTRVSQQHVDEANLAVEAARSESVAASTDRSTVLSRVVSAASGWSRSLRNSDATNVSSTQEVGRAASRLDALSQQVSDKTGLDRNEVQTIAFKLSGSIGGGFGWGKSVGISAGASASADKKYTSTLSQNEQKVLASMSREDLSEFKRFSDRVSHDTSILQSFSEDDRHGTELASRLATATGRMERADRAYAERRTMAERVSAARESGEMLSVDLSRSPERAYLMQRYTELADRYGEGSSAVQIMLSNELALQALQPTSAFRDGSALPTSFEDVRGQYDESKQDPRFHAGGVESVGADNDRTVGGKAKLHKPVSTAPSSPADGVRDSIARDPQNIATRVHSDLNQFDSKTGIVRDKDGAVHTPKSQLKQNVKSLVRDVEGMFEGGKDPSSK